MSRLFGSKGRRGAENEDLRDDMTIASSWSRGGASVSDRVMGRVKRSLSFRSSDNTRNADFSSASSVGDYSRKSTGRVKRGSSFSVKSDTFSTPLRRRRSFRTYGNAGIASSVAGVQAMEEMDSSEAMALKGQTFGRRRNKQLAYRQRNSHSQRKSNEGKLQSENECNDDEPVKYSLAELRAMSVENLKDAMSRAGVPPEDVSITLNQATAIETSDGIAEEQRKNLVALFVNSGCVKLVSLEKERKVALPEEGGGDEKGVSRPDAQSAEQNFRTLSENSADELRFSIEALPTSTDGLKRSKLEKINELKQENSQMRRENKSLKKTMKRMMGQLANAIKEVDELQNKLEKRTKEESQNDASDDLPKSSLPSHLQSTDDAGNSQGQANIQQSAQNARANSDELQPSHAVENRNGSSGSVKSYRRLDTTVPHSSSSQPSESSKVTNALINQLKGEKDAHHRTQIKLQAEIDILTKEAEGLQRELGLSLESQDNAKKRAHNSRESISKLKRELRHSSKKIKELTAEAEARDKLIETFSKILLHRKDGGEEDEGPALEFMENHGDFEEARKWSEDVLLNKPVEARKPSN